MNPLPAFMIAAALFAAAPDATAQPAESGRRPLVSYAAFTPQQRASVDAREASLRLRKAERERALGAEALSSERAPGLEDNLVHRRYWLRQEKLRHAVESAQRRSNDTLRPQQLAAAASRQPTR